MIIRKSLLGGLSPIAFGIACGTAGSSPLAAQVTSAVATAVDPTPASGEEIIVTAQRRAERLETVPMSIVALSPQALQKSGVSGLADIGRITPGVQIGFGGPSTQPAIRGVTTLTTGNGVDNNIAIYVDGFFEPSNIAINSELINISSIEILKGPQGTLYGRNATGGAILINTLAPSKTFTGAVQAKYESYNDVTGSGYLSGPITDHIRFSVGGFRRRSDSYLKLASPTTIGATTGPAAKIQQEGVRAKFEADLGSSVTLQLGYNYGYSNDPRTAYFSPYDHLSAAVPAPPGRAVAFNTVASNYKTVNSSKTHQGTALIAVDTGIGKLNWRTAAAHYRDFATYDADGTYADYSSLVTLFNTKNLQSSVDYTIDAIKNLSLTIGGMYYWEKFSGDNPTGTTIRGAGGALLIKNTPVITSESYAVFADATYHFTDKLSLDVGGRYSRDDKTFDFSSRLASGIFSVPQTQKKASFDKFTPRAALRYEIAPRTNVYATWSKGYRSGSFNPSGASSAALILPIKPESITAYEIGFKTAQRAVRFDIAGFYYKYKDINVSLIVPNPTCPAGTICPVVNLFGNAPGATIYGIDGQVVVTPIPDLNLRLGGAWLHARYDTFTNAVGTGLNAATGTNVSGQTQDWTGQQLARAPDFTANGGVDYTTHFDFGSVNVSANGAYSASYVINNASLYGPLAGAALANTQRFRQKSTFLLDGQIGFVDRSGRYSIAVYAKNLTNETYRLIYTGNSFGDYGVKAPPRTFGVRAGYKF